MGIKSGKQRYGKRGERMLNLSIGIFRLRLDRSIGLPQKSCLSQIMFFLTNYKYKRIKVSHLQMFYYIYKMSNYYI